MPLSVMWAWKVTRSTMAVTRRGPRTTFSYSENGRLEAMATLAVSPRSVRIWKKSSEPFVSSCTCGQVRGGHVLCPSPARGRRRASRGGPHLPSRQADRDRVMALADTDPSLRIDPALRAKPDVERPCRERPQLRSLNGKVLTDGLGAPEDVVSVVGSRSPSAHSSSSFSSSSSESTCDIGTSCRRRK